MRIKPSHATPPTQGEGDSVPLLLHAGTESPAPWPPRYTIGGSRVIVRSALVREPLLFVASVITFTT